MYVCMQIHFRSYAIIIFFHSFNIKWFGHTHRHTHRHTVFSVVLFFSNVCLATDGLYEICAVAHDSSSSIYSRRIFTFRSSGRPAGCLRSSLTAWTNLVKGGMFFGVLHEARSNYAAYARAWIVLLWHTNCVVHTVRTASCGGCTGLGY